FGEFFAAARKHLDAVVLERIVRGADHQPGIKPERACDVRRSGRRNHACRRNRGAFSMYASSELTLHPLARLACVAADDEAQRPGDAGGVSSQRAHEGRAEPRDRLVVERVLAGLAANAVGSEEAGHEKGARGPEWPQGATGTVPGVRGVFWVLTVLL